LGGVSNWGPVVCCEILPRRHWPNQLPPRLLIAANLGEDADTTAAITAGAIYGTSGISLEWLERLPWHQQRVGAAGDLF